MSQFKPRHYHFGMQSNPSKYQIDWQLQSSRDQDKPEISHEIHQLAYEEYRRQHPQHTYERMQERGGLSVLEIVRLLADHVERLKWFSKRSGQVTE